MNWLNMHQRKRFSVESKRNQNSIPFNGKNLPEYMLSLDRKINKPINIDVKSKTQFGKKLRTVDAFP